MPPKRQRWQRAILLQAHNYENPPFKHNPNRMLPLWKCLYNYIYTHTCLCVTLCIWVLLVGKYFQCIKYKIQVNVKYKFSPILMSLPGSSSSVCMNCWLPQSSGTVCSHSASYVYLPTNLHRTRLLPSVKSQNRKQHCYKVFST